MIKHYEQAGRVASTDPMPRTATSTAATNPISPAVLIFGAWLAGTLLFEISALDDIGLRSATSEHWGIRASMVQESSGGATELAARQSDVGRFDQGDVPLFGMSANSESTTGGPNLIDQTEFRDSFDRR